MAHVAAQQSRLLELNALLALSARLALGRLLHALDRLPGELGASESFTPSSLSASPWLVHLACLSALSCLRYSLPPHTHLHHRLGTSHHAGYFSSPTRHAMG